MVFIDDVLICHVPYIVSPYSMVLALGPEFRIPTQILNANVTSMGLFQYFVSVR